MSYNPECVDCSTVDPIAPVVPPVYDPPGGGLPAGGEPGQILVIDDDGNPSWAAGGGGGGSVTLYNTTGQSTTGGMTQKAITDELNGKATQASVTALQTEVGNKANQSAVDALTDAVVNKADQSAVNAALAQKANTSDVTSALATKADEAAVNQALANKVDKVTGKGLSTNDYTTADKTKLDGLADIKSIGSGLTLNANGELSATGGGDSTFVAEYGVTTAQELLDYLATANEPYAPILVKRGNTYYTAVISTPGTDRVNLSTFGTIGGDGYLFNYTVTGANWSSSNIGFQTKLVSGTSIKTINGESILGSGNIDIQGGVTVDDALSETSLNPVQNRVIYGALESMRQAMTGYLERLAALEAKLADYAEVTLKMSDGTNEVDKLILAKDKATPPAPTRTMFDLPNGLYDAEGNMLTDLWDGEYVSYDSDGDGNMTYYSVDVGRLYDQYPTMCGIVWCCGSGDKYSDFEIYSENPYTNGKLKWVVLADDDSAGQSFRDPIWEWGGLETVYYRGDMTVPVWEQSTTIDTVGKIPWEV